MEGNTQSVTIDIPDGSLMSYTITNSSTSPVEEDSRYMITLTAISSGTRSVPSETASVVTGDAGKMFGIKNGRRCY